VRHRGVMHHVPRQERPAPHEERGQERHPRPEVAAQHLVDDPYRGEAVEEPAEGDRVQVHRPVPGQVHARSEDPRRAPHDLAEEEERDGREPGAHREDRPTVPRAGRDADVLAVDELVVGVLVRELEVRVLHERPHVDVVAHAVAAQPPAAGVEVHEGRQQQQEEHQAPGVGRAHGGGLRAPRHDQARRGGQGEKAGDESAPRPSPDDHDEERDGSGHGPGGRGPRRHRRPSRSSSS
jgi:hypothetical protein